MSYRATRVVATRVLATRIAGSLTGLLVLGLSACAGEEASPSNSSEQAPVPSAAATSTVPDEGGSAVIPEDLCVLVSAEEVSAVVAETVAIGEDAEPGGCIYQAGSTEDLVVSLGLVTEGEAGGLEGARSELEEAVGATSVPVTVSGNEGFVVSGTLNGRPFSSGVVALDTGLFAVVTLGNGDPEPDAEVITQLLELTIGAL